MKFLYMIILLVPTGTMADIHFTNNTGSYMDYKICDANGCKYSGCSASPGGGSNIPTSPGRYAVTGSTCKGWTSYNNYQPIGTFTVPENNYLMLYCNSPTSCSP